MTSSAPGSAGAADDSLAWAGRGLRPVCPDLALIGGGRWARVWYRVLSGRTPQPQIHWLSSRNSNGVEAWLGEQAETSTGSCAPAHVYARLDELLAAVTPSLAIVANLPSEHGPTVRALLERGCHVLVEKPFVPTLAEARALEALAAEKRLILAVGLELTYATYVERFRDYLAGARVTPAAVEVVWRDVYREVRSAVPKTPDLTTSVAADLLPHVLTLLTATQGPADIQIQHAVPLRGGLEADVEFRYGSVPVRVSLSRVADRPSRLLRVQGRSGEWHTLDFSSEPGEILAPDGDRLSDPDWDRAPRPLARLLDEVLAATAGESRELPVLAERTHHIVGATEVVTKTMIQTQMALLRPFLLDDTDGVLPIEAHLALREWLAAPLLAEGLVANPKDEDELNRWSTLAWRVIHRFARHPFTTQREMADQLGLAPDRLAGLNRALQRSDEAQDLMVSQGVAMKYWENTILPLLQAGVIDATRRREPRHPFRVGVYPGVSCMFFCSFCGRQPDAKYASSTVQPGNAIFDALFRNAPPDPYTFYVSGGLEPLTNPGIGQLVSTGASRGFKLSMYTNGYMLTPQLLAKQAGLWDLDTLRISLYGVNAQSMTEVTCHPKAFGQVIQNATAFLKARNERGSRLKFGFNFVVLPGRVEEVLELAEVLASINRAAGGGRQIDFLTLREDYSVPPDRGLARAERERLAEIFDRLRDRITQPDLCDLQIDLGYALHPLSQGGTATPLEMVDYRDMRPVGYPQVSVVIDLLGDVYLYREAGFLDRPGATRYSIGRVTPEKTLQEVVAEFLASNRALEPRDGDTGFFDIFDHVVTHLLNQADDDEAFGIPFEQGPVRDRQRASTSDLAPVAHPTLAHPTLAHPTMSQPSLAGPAVIPVLR